MMDEQNKGASRFEILMRDYGVCMYDDGSEGGNISKETREVETAALDYVESLEARLAAIRQAFDVYCRVGLELDEGETSLGGELTGVVQPLFDELYKIIKG